MRQSVISPKEAAHTHTLTLVPTSQSEDSTCCYVPGTWSSTRFPILLLLLLLLNHFSRVRLCVIPEMAAHQAPPPWDSPGKNTGVGCHFLLQCMKMKDESEVAQSRLTLSNPMDCSLPDTSVHGIFQATAYTSCSISSQVLTQHIPWAPEAGKQAHPLMWNIPQTNGQSLCEGAIVPIVQRCL